MKRIQYKTYLGHAFMALAFMSVLSACTEEVYFDGSTKKSFGDALTVLPTVSEAKLVTRALSVEELMEKQLNTLDVFVEHVTGTTGDGTFMKQYHLVATDSKPIEEQVNNWLADNWRVEGLKIGEKYNIYVATNNTQTKETKDFSTFNVEALKALVADEVTDGIAVVEDGNIAWPWTDQFANTPSGFIYKQYVDEANAAEVTVGGSLYGFTTQKEFMMDGIIENWTPNPATRDQVFGGDNSDESTNKLILNRAAAKVVLNVKFDSLFLRSLEYDKNPETGEYTIEKAADKKVTITGTPAWRFYNFAFGAPVFDPGADFEGVEVHNSATLLRHPYEYAGNDKNFQIITYTYPNKWAQADYSTAAPSIVISVGYTEDGTTNYHYYRIPIVKNTITSVDRNHIYVINATIATRGSAIQEDQDVTEDIQYAVLPWNDETNNDAIHNEVTSVQHYYFRVNPTVYTLRGDGDQTVVLNYSKASGTKVNWKLFTYDADGNQISVVDKNDPNARRAWFYDADGDFTTTYGDDESGVNWSNSGPTPMGVSIVQSNEGTSGSKGTVTVTSHALNNRAIKYIRLRVYLDEVNDENEPLEETYHEDIIIRHFPTDNVQNIAGHWSSYHEAGSGAHQVTLTTTSLTEAEALSAQYGVPYTAEEINATDYINYATYSAHASDTEHYHITGPTETTYQVFHNMLQTATRRQNANSQANAVADGGEGNSYYWGTDVQTVATNVRYYNMGDYTYDYYTSGTQYNRYNLYKYQHYYTATYTHTYSYTQYSLTVEMVSTGNWVDWDDLTSHSPQRTYSYSYTNNNSSRFRAKVFEANYSSYIYYITEQGYGGNYTTTRDDRSDLTNNHMYVIQISSTSDEYVLGRPYVNPSTHQSQDDVVSPAFMIASQLGAVTVFNGTNAADDAAEHCSRYMEVANDGTRYTGWRLPTQSEIRVITRYQEGVINGVEIDDGYEAMTPVLTGDRYWALSGQKIQTSNSQPTTQGTAYLRCVRDLSADEIERLNNFEAIQEQYR